MGGGQYWKQKDQLGGFWNIPRDRKWIEPGSGVNVTLARFVFYFKIKSTAFADGLDALMGKERW